MGRLVGGGGTPGIRTGDRGGMRGRDEGNLGIRMGEAQRGGVEEDYSDQNGGLEGQGAGGRV